MAENKVQAGFHAVQSVIQLQELVSVVQKAAVLFKVSYFSLCQYPDLETKVHQGGTESRKLCISTAATFLQCANVGTDIMKRVFPAIRQAVRDQQMQSARVSLELSKTLIQKMCSDVQNVVEKYESLNGSVAGTCSDVKAVRESEQQEREKKTQEAEALRAQAHALKDRLARLNEEKAQVGRQIQDKLAEKRQRQGGCWAYSDKSNNARLSALEGELRYLYGQDNCLTREIWDNAAELNRMQAVYSQVLVEIGKLGKPKQLQEVQRCLSRVQQILLRLHNFCDTARVAIASLGQKTEAGESFLDYIQDFKEEYLKSLDEAEQSVCGAAAEGVRPGPARAGAAEPLPGHGHRSLRQEEEGREELSHGLCASCIIMESLLGHLSSFLMMSCGDLGCHGGWESLFPAPGVLVRGFHAD
ncbi:uncharacterized protein [Lepisosteus oculatus]|uniref:uncharacterized protein isoform X1 n=1 Tax=Lepisosteus oculatus TaxID=7918 RepID=UPI0035F508CF